MTLDLLTNSFPISSQTQKDCYGKPCACLSCPQDDLSCRMGNNCNLCTGKDFQRATEYCNVPNVDLD